MIVVSHRGPFRFARERRRQLHRRTAAPAASSARSAPLLGDARRTRTWIAAAIGDDDRAAVAAGAALDDLDIDLDAARRSTPSCTALHYDVVSNGMLWFLHHGLFDLARRPRFDRRFREAWDGVRRGEPAFADAVAERRGRRRRRARAGLPARARARACCATLRPDLRVVHFTHTPFCGPNSIRVLPDRRRRRDLLRRWPRCPRLPHRALGARRTARRPARCSAPTPRSRRRSPRSLGPDPRRARRGRARRRGDAAAATRSTTLVGDRLRDRAQRPHRAVEEHRARLPRVRPAARARTRTARPRRVRRDANPSREALPEYLAYRERGRAGRRSA